MAMSHFECIRVCTRPKNNRRGLTVNNVKLLTAVALTFGMLMSFGSTLEIRNVMAKQRFPWNGKVDITFEVVWDVTAELSTEYFAVLAVTATDRTNGKEYIAVADSLSGDIEAVAGAHHVVWDLTAQGLAFKSDEVVFTVAYERKPFLYCVIDLSAGENATSYPVAYMAAPPIGGFNTTEYKTNKLVLRRLEAGTYAMQKKSSVTISKPFFCGIFETTQKQYKLVTGLNPSYFKGDTLPVEKVSYDAIRGSSNGAKWPVSSAIDSGSFLGKLCARTGLDFDLPTEAQWEYACRAGTKTTYYWGDSMDYNYAWYSGNSSESTHVVGSKKANAWGLYDMSGNVFEWCLDWYGSLAYGIDPKGASSGSYRVRRGGSWLQDPEFCTSFRRAYFSSNTGDSNNGFRLVRTLVE